ncbi:MAG: hypothetical protein L6408_04270 [Nanoarchaeota archaeon]|nr:hypothetical protein [Nanoarchaeota archaeon]
MSGVGKKIGVSVEKIGEGIKRFMEGLIYSVLFTLLPGFVFIIGSSPSFNMEFFIEIVIISSVILALLCGISIRFLALMYSLSIACIPALIISLVVGYYNAEQNSSYGAFVVNFWVAIPVYILLLLMIFPWIWIYALHKHGLFSEKPAPGGIVETIKNEFVDTAMEIKRFGRRG